jgi:hypothetical protein
MKSYTTYVSLATLLLMTSVIHAEGGMRCGSKLISVGDTKADVMLKCGAPMLKEAIGLKEYSKRIDIPLTSESNSVENSTTDGNRDAAVVKRGETVTKTIDQWTYNQGTGKLLKILEFEGGELVAIKNGNRI